jgi:quercetin dioxygenase-like cupin family protein
VFGLADHYVRLIPGGDAELMDNVAGPPPAGPGLLVGTFHLTENPPHGGERHPGGDEVLLLLSGRVELHLDGPGAPEVIEVGEGEGVVVPRGVWHRVVVVEPATVVHLTPGPHSEHRPRPGA